MITQKDLDVLRAAQAANPFWFKAMIRCAEIMVPRRRKYSGNLHPYHNFTDMAQREQRSLPQIFRFYMNMKMSRLAASDQDFSDESVGDTLADVANYALLALGAILGNLNENTSDDWTEPDPNEAPYPFPLAVVDFDGVLNHYDGWTGMFQEYPMREYADKFLRDLKEAGFNIVIQTARPDTDKVWGWLKDWGCAECVLDITNLKPPALVYVDDRAIHFDGEFRGLVEKIKSFRPHWEK